jgi:hypothetical protein
MEDIMADGEYSKSARQCFVDLHSSWVTAMDSNGSFWGIGNAYDALMDYIGHHPNDPPTSAKDVSEKAAGYFEPLKNDGQWWDDMGWWGVAFLKSFYQLGFSFGLPYFEHASHCRNKMNEGREVWKDLTEKQRITYANREPKYPGGTWNRGIESNGIWPVPWCDSYHAFVGIQNTVTNALYLVLGLRYAAASNNPDYLAKPLEQYQWLQKWFGDGLKNTSLNNHGHPLIEERVRWYHDGGEVPLYAHGAVWAGDQGLIMGGLTDYVLYQQSLGNSPPGDDMDLIRGIRIASQETLLDSTNGDKKGLMLPWVEPDNECKKMLGDAGDYCNGVGVFFRFFLYAEQNVLKEPTKDFEDFLSVNANAVKDPLTAKIGGVCGITPGEMNGLANRLAILNAADVLL